MTVTGPRSVPGGRSPHVPLNEETRGRVDTTALATMRPGSFLVNTARGGPLHEHTWTPRPSTRPSGMAEQRAGAESGDQNPDPAELFIGTRTVGSRGRGPPLIARGLSRLRRS